MSNSQGSAPVYEPIQKDGLEGRALDVVVLLKAAHRLESVLQQWDSIDSREALEALAEALHYNQRLWTIYQTDLASQATPLPRDLRRNLLILSNYIDRCTMQVLAAPDRAKVRTLIDINRQLAEGLAEKPGDAAKPGSATGPAGEEDSFELCL